MVEGSNPITTTTTPTTTTTTTTTERVILSTNAPTGKLILVFVVTLYYSFFTLYQGRIYQMTDPVLIGILRNARTYFESRELNSGVDSWIFSMEDLMLVISTTNHLWIQLFFIHYLSTLLYLVSTWKLSTSREAEIYKYALVKE